MKKFNHTLLIFFMIIPPISTLGYSHLSPYSYCGGNPINCIDPTGEDIVVLNYGNDATHQHLAMLIQDENEKWQYYSINGDNVYISGVHIGGRTFNDIAVGAWDTPQDFMNSSYNVENEVSKEDKSMNHFGFQEGYMIPTTPEQDEIMRNHFSIIAKTEYNLLNNNCATAVQQSMIKAGIPVSEPTVVPLYMPVSTPFGLIDVANGYRIMYNINIIPSSAFQSIMNWNPNGTYICK